METYKDLFKQLEVTDELFSNGSIKNGQKKLRSILKITKKLEKVPNKLRHKINFAVNKSRYFDEISSFATNPKRDNLINKMNEIIRSPFKEPRKQANSIHDIQTKWQQLDLTSKPASRKYWEKFNNLSNQAWEPCKDFFDEIKEIKINNAKEREKIITNISEYSEKHKNKWPEIKVLIRFLKGQFDLWQSFAPVLDRDLNKLRKKYTEARVPINNEIKNQEQKNFNLKKTLVEKVEQLKNEDNELNIKLFIELKNEWNKLGPAGIKNEKKLWQKFNSSADKFFKEKNDKLKEKEEQINKVINKLENDEMSLNEASKEIDNFLDMKNSKEFKKLNLVITNKRKLKDELLIQSKKESYIKIFEILNGNVDIKDGPKNLQPYIEESKKNNKIDIEKVKECCVRLEILAKVESLKSDQKIKNNIQLEMLQNKFMKKNISDIDLLDDILIILIENFCVEEKKSLSKYWKRVSHCIDKIL